MDGFGHFTKSKIRCVLANDGVNFYRECSLLMLILCCRVVEFIFMAFFFLCPTSSYTSSISSVDWVHTAQPNQTRYIFTNIKEKNKTITNEWTNRTNEKKKNDDISVKKQSRSTCRIYLVWLMWFKARRNDKQDYFIKMVVIVSDAFGSWCAIVLFRLPLRRS